MTRNIFPDVFSVKPPPAFRHLLFSELAMNDNRWLRTNRRLVCPCCGKPDWCLISRNHSACICARVTFAKQCGETGWLHRLPGTSYQGPKQIYRSISSDKQHDWDTGSCRYQRQLGSDRLARLASGLGLSADSLNRLNVGWVTAIQLERLNTRCRSVGAYTFPIRSQDRKVIGIRLRAPNGFKWSVAGSQNGLLGDTRRLLIAEGPTDVVALLDLDFPAVGRASCNTGAKQLVRLVRSKQSRGQGRRIASHAGVGVVWS